MEPREVESIGLDKALSVKNRLAGRLTQARSNVTTYNSVIVGQRDASIDVRAEYERYLRLEEALVTVQGRHQRHDPTGRSWRTSYRLGEAKGPGCRSSTACSPSRAPKRPSNGAQPTAYASAFLKPGSWR